MYDDQHKAKFGHEALAGGIAFEAMKKWEDSQRKKGKSFPSPDWPNTSSLKQCRCGRRPFHGQGDAHGLHWR